MQFRAHWPAPIGLLVAWVVAFTHDLKNAFGLYDFSFFLERTGNTLALVFGVGGLLFVAWRERDKRLALRTVGVMLTETALYGLIKLATWKGLHLFARPSGTDGGFPSGHTAAHCALAFLLTERFPKLGVLWYGWAALMAWSRVESGAHFAYQTVAGAILGIGVALLFSDRAKPPSGAIE
jgi:membrane-associated phospholipid phosphatase